ncbi:MAG: galactose-1-phosphate uridylyltransferase [Planctomycetota bacterium]
MTWEERWHPLREEWVIIAAHRNDRPWSGQTEAAAAIERPRYREDCYLCPGNARVGGRRNPEYAGVHVFDNDHPCVGPDAPSVIEAPPGPFRVRRADGLARVICYTPRHDLTLAELGSGEIARLLRVWQDQYRELSARPEVAHVLVFENKGEVVGVSNPHPHCQIYATNFVFKVIETEVGASRRHWRDHGRSLLADVIDAELRDGRRIVAERDSAVAFLPHFARFSYETFVCPKERHDSIADLSAKEIEDLAAVMREVTVRFDNLWSTSFPYVCVLHQAPCDGGDHDGFHFHIEFHPPLRKPGLLKFMAGPEMGGGNFLSDTCPEDKAAELRAVGTRHWRARDD